MMPKNRRPIPVPDTAHITGYDPFGNSVKTGFSGPSSRTVARDPPSRDRSPAPPSPDHTYAARKEQQQQQQQQQQLYHRDLQDYNSNGLLHQTPTSATEVAPPSQRVQIPSARYQDFRHREGPQGDEDFYQQQTIGTSAGNTSLPVDLYSPEYQPHTDREVSPGLPHPDWALSEYGRESSRGMGHSVRTEEVPETYVGGRPAKLRRVNLEARSIVRPTPGVQPIHLTSAANALPRVSISHGRLPLPHFLEPRLAGNFSENPSSRRVVLSASRVATKRPAGTPSPVHPSHPPGRSTKRAFNGSIDVADGSNITVNATGGVVDARQSAFSRGDPFPPLNSRGVQSQSTKFGKTLSLRARTSGQQVASVTQLSTENAVDTERTGREAVPASGAAVVSVQSARRSSPHPDATDEVSAADAIDAQISAASKRSTAHAKQPVVFRAPSPQSRSLQTATAFRPREGAPSQLQTHLASRALPGAGRSAEEQRSHVAAALSGFLPEHPPAREQHAVGSLTTSVSSAVSRPASAAVHRVLPAPQQTARAPVPFPGQRVPALYTARPLTRLVRVPDVPSDPNLMITFDSSDEEDMQAEGHQPPATGPVSKPRTKSAALPPDKSLAREMAELRSLIAERERLTAAADFLNSLHLSAPPHALESTETAPFLPANAAILPTGAAPTVDSVLSEPTAAALQSGATSSSPPSDSLSSASGDSEGSISGSDGITAGAATQTTGGRQQYGSTLHGDGDRLVVHQGRGMRGAQAEVGTSNREFESLTLEELQAELAGIQASKEALELRRQLLTRLLREAKASWLELRPREAALRHALEQHERGAATAEQPTIAGSEELSVLAVPSELALAVPGVPAAIQHGAAESAAQEQTTAEVAAAVQAASEAGEAMQLRRQLLLKARERRHNQRLAAMLLERGLPLPPDLQNLPPSPQLGISPEQRADLMGLPRPADSQGPAITHGSESPPHPSEPEIKGDDEVASDERGLPPEVGGTQPKQIHSEALPTGAQLPSNSERPASSVPAQQQDKAASTEARHIKRNRSPAPPSRSVRSTPMRTSPPHVAEVPVAKRARRERSWSRGEGIERRRSRSPPPRRSRPSLPSPPQRRQSRLRTAERRHQARSRSQSRPRGAVAHEPSSRKQQALSRRERPANVVELSHPVSAPVLTAQQSSAKSVAVDKGIPGLVPAPSAAPPAIEAPQPSRTAQKEPTSAIPESSVSARLLAHLMSAESATAAPLAKSKVMPMLGVARGFTSFASLSSSGLQDGARAGPVMGVLAEHGAALGVSLAYGEPLSCPLEVASDLGVAVLPVDGHYLSPLLTFRSYRLNEAFQLASGAALTSATFAHALDPHWPLCPFEHAPRGACHNAACSFQMTVDYLLPPAPALDDVMKLANRAGGAYHTVAAPKAADLPQLASAAVASPLVRHHILLAPCKQGPPKHQRAVPPAARQAAINSAVPIYTRASVSIGGEQMDWHLPRPTAGMNHVTVGVGAARKPSLAGCQTEKQPPKQRKVDSARTGRYYSQGNESKPKVVDVALALDSSKGSAVLANAQLQEAAEIAKKVDFMAVAAVLATPADEAAFSAAANELRLGISQDGPSAIPYWRLLLLITARRARASADPGHMAEARATAAQAVAASPGCYQLWCAALEVPWRWSTHAQWLSRACLAVSSAPPRDGGHAAGEEHAQAVLDLALRLLNLWCIVGKPELAIAWGSAFASDAAGITPAETSTSDAGRYALERDIKVVGPAARRSMLRLLNQWPAEAAVIWLSCAHVAAWQRLPDAVLDRLGYQKQPAALQWSPAPAASSHVKVHALLAAAAGSGTACLNLQSPIRVTQPADMAMVRGRAAARSALALTIVRWEAATGSQAVLPSPFAVSSASCTHEEAGMQDLLAMVQRTSKASMCLPPPDPSAGISSEATESTWAQLTWPYGGAQMLQMAVQRAATPAVAQAMALSAGEPAFDAWQTATRILNGVKAALERAGYIPTGGVLPQSAFGLIVAAILAGGGEERGHKRGTVAVATAALVQAAAALIYTSGDGDTDIASSQVRSKSRSSSRSRSPSSSGTSSGSSSRSSSSSRSRSSSPSSSNTGSRSSSGTSETSSGNRSSGSSSSSGDSQGSGSSGSGSSSGTSRTSNDDNPRAQSPEPHGPQSTTAVGVHAPSTESAPVVPSGVRAPVDSKPSTATPGMAVSEAESGEVSGCVSSPNDSSTSSSSRSGGSSSSSQSGSGTTSTSSDSAVTASVQRPPLSSHHRQRAPRTVAEARLAFTARLLAPVNFRGGKAVGGAALEDGEIRERAARVDEAAQREQCIFAGLNLALLEALGQNGAAALAAIDEALTAAEGVDDALQLRIWSETLSLAMGIVTDSISISAAVEASPASAPSTAPRAAATARATPAGWSGWAAEAAEAAASTSLAPSSLSVQGADAAKHAAVRRRRERFAGFLALVRRFLSWRGVVSEQPLLASRLDGQASLDDPVLEVPRSPDASGVVEVLLPLLGFLLPAEAVALTEAAFDLLPATPAVARLILGVMARRPADAAAAVAWALPLLRACLACSTPRLPPDLALAVVQLAERAGGGTALILAQQASQLQPAAQLLLQKVAQLKKADQLQRATPAAGNASHSLPSP